MPLRFALCGLLLLATAAHAQSPVPPEVLRAADRIEAAQLARDLAYLSSDALRGRNTPSPGFDTAAAYIARRLAAAGLKPLGDDGTYFQHYELREERVDTAGAYLEAGGTRLRFGRDFVVRSFAEPLQGTLPVVYVGYGWRAPERGIDPYAGVDVRGKLMLVAGPVAPPEGSGIRQLGRVNIGGTSPFTEAERRGAAGVLIIARNAAAEGWNRLRANQTYLELHPRVPSAYAALPLTALTLTRDAAAALLAGERASAAQILETSGVPSFELSKTVVAHVPLARRIVHRPYNVVALLEGREPALNEYVTVAAHLDGAVGNDTVDGDSIYNSADDNASGSAGTLAVAEAMARAPRPRRSVIFIWDSGEERGLWGTRHFVHTPPVPLQNVVAHFNIDMIGASRAPGSPDSATQTVTGPNEVYLKGPGVLSPTVDSLLARVNRAHVQMEFNRFYDTAESSFFYPRTDAGPFLERGVLTIGFSTGLHDRYHLPADEAHHLDPQKIERIARMVMTSIWAVADAAARSRIEREIPETVPRYR